MKKILYLLLTICCANVATAGVADKISTGIAKIPDLFSIAKSSVPEITKLQTPAISKEIIKEQKVIIGLEQPNNKLSSDDGLTNASAAINNNRYETALSYYKEILAKDSHNTAALFGVAVSYQLLAQYQQAKVAYLKLLTIEPEHINGLTNFFILLDKGSQAETLASLNSLLSISQNSPKVLGKVGEVYVSEGNYQAAASVFARALSLEPDNLNFQVSLAVLFDKMNQRKYAIHFYETVLESASENSDSNLLPESFLNDIAARVTYLKQAK